MSNSLPAAQRLFERYKGDERVGVVAVATAFEKAQYPFMADEAQIAEQFKSKHWEFPVMRDVPDETIVRTLTLSGSTGTPMTVVIDSGGIVRWHGFNGNAESSRSVEQTVERLLDSFYVAPLDPAIPLDASLAPAAKAYAAKDYAKARAESQAIAAKSDVAEDVKTQAQTIIDNVDQGIERLAAAAQAKLDGGYPSKALAKIDEAAKIFRGVPAVTKVTDQAKAWRSSPVVTKSLAAERELEKALKPPATTKNVKDTKAATLKQLDRLAETYKDTPVLARIKAAAESLRK